MGEEDSVPRSDPENLKKRVDAGGAHTGAAGASAGGEPTLDTGESGAAVAKDRMSIGPYVLVKKLGEGGMGQVWLAEQTSPVKRQVALKLIKGGLYDSAVIQRFEAERQSLAVMNHPAIAKVFDAGSTADGQPYFVMEYVDGRPITRYCDNKKLKIRERLELFIKMCEGVQHAHQKAIIHRDLKPSNILVAEVDGKPVPRIIDFGLAKAISPQLGGEQTQFTQMGAFVGTRGFMSPEQADPSVLDVDTRTDVYSLGVVLYVLLTGMLPFDSEGEKKKPIDEVLRQLREEDPPSPSAKLIGDKQTQTDSAMKRTTQARQLVAVLRGDLDWITMKALEKDRARRYGTPMELAADIERYLENRPVEARPAGAGYRLKKYVRRHRVGVAVTAGATGLLVAFAVMQGVQLRRTTRERDRANRITEFMTGMFKVSDPSEARGNSVTAREILDKASKDIDAGLAKDPELQAQMMTVMGNVYEALGLYQRAQSLLERSVEVRRRVLGPNNPDTLKSMSTLGFDLGREGRYVDAEKIDRQTIDLQRRVLGPEHPDTLVSMRNLGWTVRLEGRYAEAEKLDRETLEIRRRVLGPENLDTVASMSIVAVDLRGEGKYADAEKLERETLEIRKRVQGPEHPDTLLAMTNLGQTLQQENRYSEAEKLELETLEIERRVLGPEHPSTLGLMNNLAIDLRSEGKYAEAEELDRQTLEIRRRVLGPEHPDTISTMNGLANSLYGERKYAEAEKMDREALEIRRRILGPNHPGTLRAMGNVAADLRSEGKYAEAEKMDREALEIIRRVLGPNRPETLEAMGNVVADLKSEGKYTEAEQTERGIFDTAHRVFGPDHPYSNSSAYDLACIVAHRGRRDEAFSLLHEAVDHGLRAKVALGIEKDPDLKSLHGDPRFSALVTDAKQRAAAAQKAN
jgi:serine/threonine protein kinase